MCNLAMQKNHCCKSEDLTNTVKNILRQMFLRVQFEET